MLLNPNKYEQIHVSQTETPPPWHRKTQSECVHPSWRMCRSSNMADMWCGRPSRNIQWLLCCLALPLSGPPSTWMRLLPLCGSLFYLGEAWECSPAYGSVGREEVSEWTKQLAAAQGHQTALIWCHISSETDTSWHLGLSSIFSASVSPPDLWLIIHTQVTSPPSWTSTPNPPCCPRHVLCSRSLKWKPRFEISGVLWGSKRGNGSWLMASER